MNERRLWVPERGFVLEREATAEELRLADDMRWILGRPDETLKATSRARKPQVRRGFDLADAERAILDDEWIGDNQRSTMLREVRLLAQFMASRRTESVPR